MRKIWTRRSLWVLGGFLCLFGLVAGVSPGEEIVTHNLLVFGQALAGLTKEQALQAISSGTQALEEGSIVFKAGRVSYAVPAEALGLRVNRRSLEAEVGRYLSRTSWLYRLLFLGRGPETTLGAEVTLGNGSEAKLEEIAQKLSCPPEGPKYVFEGRDLKIMAARPGQQVTAADVRASLRRVYGNEVEVSYIEIPPQGTEFREELSLLAEFTTSYDTNEKDREVNLILAAEAVHQKMLLPGEVLSFNAATGERTAAKGYRYAMVVVGDHLEPGLAGGICQVSTTLFNAAALAGLEIPQVEAHSIPVDYVPPGRDAAVAWPSLDLKIRNNQAGPVVFGVWVEEGQVVARVYGRKTDRSYTLETVTLREIPEPGKSPGLVVATYRLEKRGERVSRELLMTNTYVPHVPMKP